METELGLTETDFCWRRCSHPTARRWAPLFAAAIATQESKATFLVGLAASVGAGISMGFAEALSDDGSLTGRGRPWIRGLMTALGGMVKVSARDF
jgi:hypothetical protein